MNAKELFDAGRVRDAQAAVAAYLRDNPADIRQRTFLFELLCFSGDYDRAEKHLHILAAAGGPAELGAVMYFSALHAERARNELFEALPGKLATNPGETSSASLPVSGTLNGKAFAAISDADPAIGPRLEMYAAGAYLWIGFEHIQSIQMQPPRRLRDTLWAPATVITGPSFNGTELGEVLIPVIYPFSWRDADETVWLGRATEWVRDEQERERPVGQKTLVVDGDEFPLLEVRALEFEAARRATT